MAESEQQPASRNAQQRDQARIWLADVWPEPRTCPMCKSTDRWNVGDAVVTPLFGQPLGGLVSIYFPVTCLTCGYTHFFDGIVMGIFEGNIEPLP